jgi:hypothetical protein
VAFGVTQRGKRKIDGNRSGESYVTVGPTARQKVFLGDTARIAGAVKVRTGHSDAFFV